MSVQSSSSRVRLSAEERREQLLAAATRAFEQGGYHGTHVTDVIREAGVARGTFYLHFDSKEAVFTALVERMLAVFDAAAGEERPVPESLEQHREGLRATYLGLFSAFRDQRGLCRLLLEEAVGLDRAYRDRVEQHYAGWRGRIVRSLEGLRGVGLLRDGVDPEFTAEVIIGYVERVTRRFVLDDTEPDLDAVVERLVDLELAATCRATEADA